MSAPSRTPSGPRTDPCSTTFLPTNLSSGRFLSQTTRISSKHSMNRNLLKEPPSDAHLPDCQTSFLLDLRTNTYIFSYNVHQLVSTFHSRLILHTFFHLSLTTLPSCARNSSFVLPLTFLLLS